MIRQISHLFYIQSLGLLLFTFLILGLLSATSFSQEVRYNAEVFEAIEVESDIIYGNAVTQGGVEQELKMDIYYPKNDTASKRTLVIFAHGGYFLFGDKLGFKEEAVFLAHSGYVVASIDYRLIDVEENEMVSKCAVIDAMNDLKAAVRFFYQDAQKNNEYRIDTEGIFIGGYSAGAVTSLHYAYATTNDDVLAMGGESLLKYVKGNGGIEGNSGNQGYPSKVRGVINIAGSIHHTALIEPDEPIIISVHGTEDQVVPFLSGTTGETTVVTEGSGLIHKKADEIGLTNRLIRIEGDNHLARYSCVYCPFEIRKFLFENR